MKEIESEKLLWKVLWKSGSGVDASDVDGDFDVVRTWKVIVSADLLGAYAARKVLSRVL